MDLTQIIYSSRPFGYDDTSLHGILMEARSHNPKHDITGALICRRDVFLQLLEGPEDKVAATLGRIRKDDRHVELTLRYSAKPAGRMFGEWAMLHDPATSWLWSMEEVSNGALEAATPDEILDVFVRMAAAQVEL